MTVHLTRGVRLATLAVLAVVPLALGAQEPTRAATPRPLSLADAIRVAQQQSEAIQIANAGVQRATGQHYIARSQYLPQLSGSLGYTRTLRSQFSKLAGGGGPDTATGPQPQSVCAPEIPANATAAEIQAALAQASTCKASGGINFSKVGFGAQNQWVAGLNLSQNVFTFGRIAGQNTAANAQLRSSEIEVSAQRAQLALDVTQAYYNATLADRLVAIADSSLAQTEEVLRQTQLAKNVGNESEFSLLRAQVTRDNQVPVLIQRRSDRQTAYLRLKQLLNVSLDDSLLLTTPVDSAAAGGAVRAVAEVTPALTINAGAAIDTVVSDRAPVREVELAVRAQEGLTRVARAERYPSISITSGYQRLFFPVSVFPQLGDYSENWTVGASLGVSLFSGGRVSGDVMVAQANLAQARAQAQQTRELAALDTRIAINQLAQAEATYTASAGTSAQAQRAYGIDQVRFREGLSTQTDLAQSRLLLEQAEANRAVAARDLAVARVRLALLRDLPLQLTAGGAQAGAPGATSTAAPQQTTTQQQTTTTQTSASTTTGATSGQTGTPGGQNP